MDVRKPQREPPEETERVVFWPGPPAGEVEQRDMFRSLILRSLDVRLRDMLNGSAINAALNDHLLDAAEKVAEQMIAAISTVSVWDDRVGPFYSAATVSTLLSITRQATHKKMQRRQLLGLPVGGDVVYPTFQFHGTEPLPHLSDVLTQLDPDDRDRWGDALWLLTPLDTEGGPTPADLLRSVSAGRTVQQRNLNRVLAEARDAGQLWAS